MRDSAGVRIVENPAAATAPVKFRLAPKPDMVIGGIRDRPDDELNPKLGYIDAVRMPGNRLLVTDGEQLKLFDSTGHLISKLGRNGAGPGEFRTAQTLCRFRGDSILVWDVSNRRISVWSSSGKLAREYTPPGFTYGNGCTLDGSLIANGVKAESPRADLPLSLYVVVSSAGVAGAGFGPLPSTLYSGSIYRDLRIGAHGDHFYFGDAVTLGVRVLDRTGKVTAIFRTTDRAEPITDASLQAHPMMCIPDRVTKICTPQPTKATTWPAYYAMLVDDNGSVWERLNQGGHDSVWVAFDSTGKLLGKLLLPPAAKTAQPQIIRFGKGEVIVADLDDDGARRVSVYRLVPGQ